MVQMKKIKPREKAAGCTERGVHKIIRGTLWYSMAIGKIAMKVTSIKDICMCHAWLGNPRACLVDHVSDSHPR